MGDTGIETGPPAEDWGTILADSSATFSSRASCCSRRVDVVSTVAFVKYGDISVLGRCAYGLLATAELSGACVVDGEYNTSLRRLWL